MGTTLHPIRQLEHVVGQLDDSALAMLVVVVNSSRMGARRSRKHRRWIGVARKGRLRRNCRVVKATRIRCARHLRQGQRAAAASSSSAATLQQLRERHAQELDDFLRDMGVFEGSVCRARLRLLNESTRELELVLLPPLLLAEEHTVPVGSGSRWRQLLLV
jgi:hypothetical protein